MRALLLGAVVVIAFLDWATPAGVVVGILLVVPVLLSARSDARRDVWLVWSAATAAFVVAAVFGEGPISPSAVWVPNRLLTLLALLGSLFGGLGLQRARLAAEMARGDALRSRDLTAFLHSLLTHELRSSLSTAVQTLGYAEDAAREGRTVDRAVIGSVRARTGRSLAGVDQLLELSRQRLAGEPAGTQAHTSEVAASLAGGARGFEEEASLRGVVLDVKSHVSWEGTVACDMLLLRQGMAVLLGTALRSAADGRIGVEVEVDRERVTVTVTREDDREGSPADAERLLDTAVFERLVRDAGGELAADRPGRSRLILPLRPGGS